MNDTQYCIQGDEYCAKGLYEMAISQYTRALDINPMCRQAYTGRGLVYCLHIKDLHEAAVSDFTKAIELDPSDPVPFHGRGLIYYMTGLYDLALNDFNRVLELNPRWGVGLFRTRGEIYLNKGRFDLAESDFTRAIELNPEYALAYKNRALARYMKKDYEQAMKDVEIAGKFGVEMEPAFLISLRTALREREAQKPSVKENASIVSFPLPVNARKLAGGL